MGRTTKINQLQNHEVDIKSNKNGTLFQGIILKTNIFFSPFDSFSYKLYLIYFLRKDWGATVILFSVMEHGLNGDALWPGRRHQEPARRLSTGS